MGVVQDTDPPLRLVAQSSCYSVHNSKEKHSAWSFKEVPTVWQHFCTMSYYSEQKCSVNREGLDMCDFILELKETVEFLRLHPHLQK